MQLHASPTSAKIVWKIGSKFAYEDIEMKLMLILIVGLFFFSLTADSQVTDADLNKIRLVVKEEVEKAVEASEKRMKEYISQEIKSEIRPVNNTITEMDKRLNNIFVLVITLIAFIAAIVGIPQIIIAMQGKNIKEQDQRIESLHKQIENLLQEIQTLKQERIVRP